MDIEDTEKKKSAKKRLSLGNSHAVRESLCKLARMYHNDQIPDVKIRNLTYVLNSIIAADRFITESELSKRIEQLENLVRGEGGTVIDQKELESPYAANLKKQLGNEQKINTELNTVLLNLKRELARFKANSENSTGETD